MNVPPTLPSRRWKSNKIILSYILTYLNRRWISHTPTNSNERKKKPTEKTTRSQHHFFFPLFSQEAHVYESFSQILFLNRLQSHGYRPFGGDGRLLHATLPRTRCYASQCLHRPYPNNYVLLNNLIATPARQLSVEPRYKFLVWFPLISIGRKSSFLFQLFRWLF